MTRTGVDQPCGSDRLAAGPGAAANQQARLAPLDLQQLALVRLGQNRLDHVLTLGQRCDLGQVGVWRLPGEVLLEVIGRDRRIDVAVLDLHRYAIS